MQLAQGFEDDLEAAILADAETTLMGPSGEGGLVDDVVDKQHGRLNDYSYTYTVDPIKESLVEPTLERTERGVRISWGWTHEATIFFEMGTSKHTVNGNPILSFIWEDAPPGIHEMFPDTERVDGDPRVFFPKTRPTGISETRFIRYGLWWLRQQLSTHS